MLDSCWTEQLLSSNSFLCLGTILGRGNFTWYLFHTWREEGWKVKFILQVLWVSVNTLPQLSLSSGGGEEGLSGGSTSWGWGPCVCVQGCSGSGRMATVVWFEWCQKCMLHPNLPMSSKWHWLQKNRMQARMQPASEMATLGKDPVSQRHSSRASPPSACGHQTLSGGDVPPHQSIGFLILTLSSDYHFALIPLIVSSFLNLLSWKGACIPTSYSQKI